MRSRFRIKLVNFPPGLPVLFYTKSLRLQAFAVFAGVRVEDRLRGQFCFNLYCAVILRYTLTPSRCS